MYVLVYVYTQTHTTTLHTHTHIHNGDDDDSDGRTRNSTLRAAAAVYALIALENVTLPTKLAKLSDNLTPFFKKTNNYILPNYLTI